MQEQNFLSVGENIPLPDVDLELKAPRIEFGRCSITGEFGPVISLHLGQFIVRSPKTDIGVEVDPNTGEVTFTEWNEDTADIRGVFSKRGLELMAEKLETSVSPIKPLSPELVYGWNVLFVDGSGISQFGAEQEHHWGHVLERNRPIKQVSYLPRNSNLPVFTFDFETGIFYKSGEPIDVGYPPSTPMDRTVICARSVVQTWGSTGQLDGSRSIEDFHGKVLYLLGWNFGGPGEMGNQNTKPCCIIGIDYLGNWRPFKYTA
jgi:hypothetical protein